MADTLTLKEVELDYEADEVEDVRGDDGTDGTPREEDGTPREEDGEVSKEETDSLDLKALDSSLSKEDNGSLDGVTPSPEKNGEEEVESGEELEDGELSDEDETAKNERLEPKPICRFYSKGQCTWGASCRFMHPGVLDKGNYSMFAPPRPILPGEPEEPAGPEPAEPILIAPAVPAFESAWERGLRQAKEQRRRSAKRKEMDVEYEEKKSSMSLTQIELDKENDYYMRPASPAHTYDPYADDDPTTDPYDTYHPEVRRIAPPPPPEFLAKEDGPPRRYSHSPPPNVRRVAPPRSPEPGREPGSGRPPRPRGQEDWADPWMRSREEKRGAPPGGRVMGRIRSYSSGSSRSSSSGSSRSRSPPPRNRHYSNSSVSSHSSSRSRSSTPPGIPRRKPTPTQKDPAAPSKNTAPLQKRLAGAAPTKPSVPKPGAKPSSKPLLVPKLEADRDRKPNIKALERKNKTREGRSSSSDSEGGGKSPRRRTGPPRPDRPPRTNHRSNGRENKDGKDPAIRSKEKPKDPTKLKDGSKSKEALSSKPKEPFKMNISVPKNQIKLTLKTSHTAKPANQTVLEKLGMTNEDLVEAQKVLKRKPGEETAPKTTLKRKPPGQESTDSPKKKKPNPDNAEKKKVPAPTPTVETPSPTKLVKPKVGEAVDKLKAKEKKAKSATDAQGRREELLKQLKAVEDAITRKRTKLEK